MEAKAKKTLTASDLENLKAAITGYGKLKAFAEALGVSTQTVRRIAEMGNCRERTVAKILAELEKSKSLSTQS